MTVIRLRVFILVFRNPIASSHLLKTHFCSLLLLLTQKMFLFLIFQFSGFEVFNSFQCTTEAHGEDHADNLWKKKQFRKLNRQFYFKKLDRFIIAINFKRQLLQWALLFHASFTKFFQKAALFFEFLYYVKQPSFKAWRRKN